VLFYGAGLGLQVSQIGFQLGQPLGAAAEAPAKTRSVARMSAMLAAMAGPGLRGLPLAATCLGLAAATIAPVGLVGTATTAVSAMTAAVTALLAATAAAAGARRRLVTAAVTLTLTMIVCAHDLRLLFHLS
jgi:hypothetical protein